MKKFLLPIIVLMAVFLPSCKGDVNTDLKGKTFTYWNGEFGSWNITSTYEFQNTGNVYHELQIGYSDKYDTDGCSLFLVGMSSPKSLMLREWIDGFCYHKTL